MPSPKKQPTDHQIPAYGWGKRSKYLDLTLPSGAIVQVRRPDPQQLIREGLLDELDTLTGAVAGTVIPAAKGEDTAAGPAAFDKEKVLKSLAAMDRIVLAVVIQPIVVAEEADAVDGAYWVGDVDVTDKTFIVKHAAGGSSDLDRFRDESEVPVGSVPAGP